METSQQQGLASGVEDGDYVEFFRAGTLVKGIFQCVSCSEVIVNLDVLTACPRCGDMVWERGEWMPFQRGRRR